MAHALVCGGAGAASGLILALVLSHHTIMAFSRAEFSPGGSKHYQTSIRLTRNETVLMNNLPC